MLGINQAHYIGSVASQPDMKYTPGGLAILELTVAGRGEVVTAEGEVKHPAFYNRCKCFGKYAEALSEKEMIPEGEAYRPWRSAAAWYCWRALETDA